jgi:hypothetical protein
MDKGPSDDIIPVLHERYGSAAHPPEHTDLTPYDSDWDILYPVSSFLDTYRFKLDDVPEFDWPHMGWNVVDTAHGDGRHLHFTLNFVSQADSTLLKSSQVESSRVASSLASSFADPRQTGLVWPTLAFEAEVEEWSFDFAPPKGKKRHHIKIATSADEPMIDLELTMRNKDPIKVFWSAVGRVCLLGRVGLLGRVCLLGRVGLLGRVSRSLGRAHVTTDGNQMVPQTASRLGPDMPASKVMLDMDAFCAERWKGSLDVILGGIVTGVIDV